MEYSSPVTHLSRRLLIAPFTSALPFCGFMRQNKSEMAETPVGRRHRRYGRLVSQTPTFKRLISVQVADFTS